MKTLKEKRLIEIYKLRNSSTDSQRKEMLDICLAILNDKQIKLLVEAFNLIDEL